MEKRTIVEKNGKKILIKLVSGEGWQHVKLEEEGKLPHVHQFDTRQEAETYYDCSLASYAG